MVDVHFNLGILILLLVIPFIFLAGCTLLGVNFGEQPIPNTNNIITIEGEIISSNVLDPGDTVTASFLIKNNDVDQISGVEVNFFNVVGFQDLRIDCEDAEETGQKCIFNEIGSKDTRQISLSLKVPTAQYITNPFIEYYVSYNYSGFRLATIPIINTQTRTTALGKFTQSTPSPGPIVLEFILPVQNYEIKDDQKIPQYWAKKGEPFDLKIKLTHRGTVSGVQTPITIDKGKVQLDLKDALIKATSDGTPLRCDFDGDSILYSNKDAEVSGDELVCNLINKEDFDDPEITASISADFYYDYIINRKYTFTVQTPT